jgi:hypothetical protein
VFQYQHKHCTIFKPSGQLKKLSTSLQLFVLNHLTGKYVSVLSQ